MFSSGNPSYSSKSNKTPIKSRCTGLELAFLVNTLAFSSMTCSTGSSWFGKNRWRQPRPKTHTSPSERFRRFPACPAKANHHQVSVLPTCRTANQDETLNTPPSPPPAYRQRSPGNSCLPAGPSAPLRPGSRRHPHARSGAYLPVRARGHTAKAPSPRRCPTWARRSSLSPREAAADGGFSTAPPQRQPLRPHCNSQRAPLGGNRCAGLLLQEACSAPRCCGAHGVRDWGRRCCKHVPYVRRLRG